MKKLLMMAAALTVLTPVAMAQVNLQPQQPMALLRRGKSILNALANSALNMTRPIRY